MNGYKDLEIFRESKRLAIRVHEMTMTLPKFEIYEEGSQLRRCSKAVSALIAEGYGRSRYKSDYVRYLVMSHAECDETIVHLDFIFETHSFTDENIYKELKNAYTGLSKRISKFIAWVDLNS